VIETTIDDIAEQEDLLQYFNKKANENPIRNLLKITPKIKENNIKK